MKHLNRLLAVLLAALTLCAALPLGAVAEVAIDLGEPEGLEGLEGRGVYIIKSYSIPSIIEAGARLRSATGLRV